ncbi:hypothetical protein EJ04DRAFT_569961 [Polyplosphaeria fusca]|uniref:Fungal N-terminal domain-containing protein n=1 Tax=Polyplosphaeria fusca TaxID=682080 RepID=A0A9P4QLI9_9PLEO|nr:hypothetical protein EJ04DRAFT_569961 [Polyplosphaeria fusca]
MAEVVGAIASVITIIESTARITKLIISCTNAIDESRILMRELGQVRGLLETLKETIEAHEVSNETWSSTILHLQDDGIFQQYKQLLDVVEIGLTATSHGQGFRWLKACMTWPYKEAETLKLVSAMERYKFTFGIALGNNQIRLSKAIQDNIKAFSTDFDHIKNKLQRNAEQLQSLSEKTCDVSHSLEAGKVQLKDLSLTTQRIEEMIHQQSGQIEALRQHIGDDDYERILE